MSDECVRRLCELDLRNYAGHHLDLRISRLSLLVQGRCDAVRGEHERHDRVDRLFGDVPTRTDPAPRVQLAPLP